ncbi:MAG: UDP-N-acetylglucosamine 2-epimerase [Actinomycetia bacterium]|nr:UDP-N-acetylglucosamine 2-epimerase [Actinomycetes bacterium]
MSAILHVVGARPNFMKMAPVLRAGARRGLPQLLVHTGQHYDSAMSDVFFTELGLPEPDVNLGVGSGTHAQQTAALMTALEATFVEREPSIVVVYGDVNSTIAAALVASKLHIRVAHVEAGLRSFDWTMPEEVNRRVTDLCSDVLFATSPEAIGHLGREGVDPARVHFVGNPMIDTLLANLDRFDIERFRASHGLTGAYALVTLHRPSNVDDPDAARRLVTQLTSVSERVVLVFPVHPRGRALLESAGLRASDRLRVIDPIGYVEFLSGVRGAALVITDSGGVQEETTVLNVPCLTARPNTERPITITHGTNRLVALDDIAKAADEMLANPPHVAEPPPLWDGRSGERIAEVLQAETL